jgi:hypothetical protein
MDHLSCALAVARSGRWHLEDTPNLKGMPRISRADVAAFLLKTVESGSFVRQTVALRAATAA